MDDIISEEWAHIHKTSKALAGDRVSSHNLPAVNVRDELSQPVGFGNLKPTDHDFQMLIDMRLKHQTEQAAAGVRTRNIKSVVDNTSEMRRSIIREF